jgi:hypothetical protein
LRASNPRARDSSDLAYLCAGDEYVCTATASRRATVTLSLREEARLAPHASRHQKRRQANTSAIQQGDSGRGNVDQAKFAERRLGVCNPDDGGRCPRASGSYRRSCSKAGRGSRRCKGTCQRQEAGRTRHGDGRHRHPPRYRARDLPVKRESTSIVEAVSAEDIGKLPDVSIAESIGRLPGISLRSASAGRAQVISVRGLSPDFSTTTAQWPRDGQHRRQPQRRVRPVPVRAAQRRDRLQDARRQPHRPGPVGHDRHADRASAELRRSVAVVGSLRGQRNSLGSAANSRSANGNRINASYIDQFGRPHAWASRSVYSHTTRRSRKTRSVCTNPGRPLATTGARACRRHLLLRRHQGLAPHRRRPDPRRHDGHA